jgi:hypothetical protein
MAFEIQSLQRLLGGLLREPGCRIELAALQGQLAGLKVGLGLPPPGFDFRSHTWQV